VPVIATLQAATVTKQTRAGHRPKCLVVYPSIFLELPAQFRVEVKSTLIGALIIAQCTYNIYQCNEHQTDKCFSNICSSLYNQL